MNPLETLFFGKALLNILRILSRTKISIFLHIVRLLTYDPIILGDC